MKICQSDLGAICSCDALNDPKPSSNIHEQLQNMPLQTVATFHLLVCPLPYLCSCLHARCPRPEQEHETKALLTQQQSRGSRIQRCLTQVDPKHAVPQVGVQVFWCVFYGSFWVFLWFPGMDCREPVRVSQRGLIWVFLAVFYGFLGENLHK